MPIETAHFPHVIDSYAVTEAGMSGNRNMALRVDTYNII